MTLQLQDNDYILGIWFSESKNFGNIMVIMKKGDNDKTWEGHVRIRYYSSKSSDPFNGEDEKSFYGISFKDAIESEMIEKIEEFIKNFTCNDLFGELKSLDHPFISDRVIVQGNLDIMMDKVKDKDWFHLKKLNDKE